MKYLPWIIVFWAAFWHLFRIAQIPAGFYIDELNIAVSAKHIAQNLHDEHSAYLPLYFEGFGEYKNPVYIYLVAGMFKLFGASFGVLKLTSWLCFVVALWGFYKLSQLLWQDWRTQNFALLVFSFLPQYFIISRTGFELVATIPLLVWSLYFLLKSILKTEKLRVTLLNAFISGVLFALTIYSYSTMRVGVPLILGAALLFYGIKYWKQGLALAVGLALAIIPFVNFLLTTHNLTKRFDSISYVATKSLTTDQKLEIFKNEYKKYWKPVFLYKTGDKNLRHSTGQIGIIFFVIFLLMWLQFARYIMDYKRVTREEWFMLSLLLLSVVPAAMTDENTPHAMRALPTGLFAAILASYGFNYVLKLKNWALNILIVSLLIGQIITFINNYFTVYPAKSAEAFGLSNIDQKISVAKDSGCETIYLKNYEWPNYVADWYGDKYGVRMEYPFDPLNVSQKCVVENN